MSCGLMEILIISSRSLHMSMICIMKDSKLVKVLNHTWLVHDIASNDRNQSERLWHPALIYPFMHQFNCHKYEYKLSTSKPFPRNVAMWCLITVAWPRLQLYPFGSEAGDTLSPVSDDGGTGPVSLRFGRLPYFGSFYQTIYVGLIISCVL